MHVPQKPARLGEDLAAFSYIELRLAKGRRFLPGHAWPTPPVAAHYGSASAMYSLGMSSQPTATTMYCVPSTA